MKAKSIFVCIVVTLYSLYMSCNSSNHISDPNLSSNPTSNTNNCKELAGTTSSPVTLGELLCIARDSSDVLYLVDKYQYNVRIFVLKKNTLYRKKILGSSIFGERYYFLSIEDTMQFVFQNQASVWSDAYILKGKCEECDSLFNNHVNRDGKSINNLDAGWSDVCLFLQSERPNSVQLTIAAVNEITSYGLENFPPATHIEYLAQQQSGQYLLVTRPYYDWNGDVVVHYGLTNQMSTCFVTGFVRASDGGSTWITFKVGLKSYEAFFGVTLNATGVSNGKSWLRIDNDTLNLERTSADIQALKAIGFDCSITLQ